MLSSPPAPPGAQGLSERWAQKVHSVSGVPSLVVRLGIKLWNQKNFLLDILSQFFISFQILNLPLERRMLFLLPVFLLWPIFLSGGFDRFLLFPTS